ncbi:hypothetical protein VPNG_04647 [Cytospora leucostoma]|uniref:Stc1 domain-containing protein n=1 Tax=Cytospora leucostoma TaxID=1230097 RepID=A0A423XAL5_9PEZI|nr:hypothetical protein VPNG_04647 [Cytospora leucostoma]
MSANYWSEQKNKSVPTIYGLRLKCAGDGKWESKDMFSKNMLQKYNRGQRPITCRKHTAGPATEMVCSTCHKTKPLDCFSNANRKVNGNRRCRACVEWTESDVAGHAPLPAPNNMRSLEEREFYQRPRQTLDVFDGAQQHDNGGHEDEEYRVEVTEGVFISDGASSVGQSTTTPADTTTSLTSYALKNFNASDAASSRGGQSYHASSAPTDTASTIGTASTVGRRNYVQFNAYGPDGQVQKRVQSTTAASVTTATTVSSTDVPGRKNWPKVASRKVGLSTPAYLQYENPDEVGQCDNDSDESADEC